MLGTPISENAFTGLGGGIALDGRFRPVVELMYADFMWVAADQLFNQIGKARHMYGGDGDVPFVLRSKVAMGTGYGSQHSMDPAGIFATAPGWRIVAPTTPFDYVGLMNSRPAVRRPGRRARTRRPLRQHRPRAGRRSRLLPARRLGRRAPRGNRRHRAHLPRHDPVRARRGRRGAGRDAEVIDLRWLDRASLDWDTIGASIRKTNRVLIAEQGPLGTSYGSWLADEIQRRYFDWLDHPVERVTGGEASPSISKVLERAAMAEQAEIESALRTLGGH